MSRISELLLDLCQDGVQFKPLGELISLNFGSRITKSKDAGTAYPVYGGGGESFRTDSFNREDEWVISRFAMSKNCVRRVSGPFWMLDSGFTFDVRASDLDKEFVGQTLLNMQDRIFETSTQSAQKNIDIQGFKRLRIPIPPLQIQREIVRILDQFREAEAELEVELEAELEARSRQYLHYRESLFAFGAEEGIPRVAMGDVGEFFRGRRFTKDDVVADGIMSIHYGEIYTHYGVSAATTVSQVRHDLRSKLRFALPGDVVIAGVGETVEDVGKAVAWMGEGEVAIHDDCFGYRHSLNPKFVSYFFQTSAFHAQKGKYVARAKVKRLSGESLSKIHIPIPPVSEQVRIVAILDKFEALVRDFSVELSAELIARRKQYDYYRDRLLSFEEDAA